MGSSLLDRFGRRRAVGRSQSAGARFRGHYAAAFNLRLVEYGRLFRDAGGFSSLAFGDYRTGIAAAIVANGNRGMNDVLRRFLPLTGGLRNAA